MKPGISAVVVVYNQSEYLKKALDCVKDWVDEIVIIDLESEEDIQSIAKSYNAKYISHKKVKIVEEIRQQSIKYASHEYILFLDPDEEIGGELAADLEAKIIEGDYDYFVIPRCNFVFGKWVTHSRWWPDFQIRVFRHNKVTWGTHLHAAPEPTGTGFTYEIDPKYAIKHQNYKDIDEFISKNMRYAKQDATDRVASGDKFTLLEAMRLSVSELISRFFVAGGYKDGMLGLALSIFQSYYYFMVYFYFWEASKYADLESDESIKSFPRNWFSHSLKEVMHHDKSTSKLKIFKEKLVRRMIG